VAPSGNVEWLCVPQYDSPSVFAAILDRDAGRFRFGPTDAQVPAARRYLPGGIVLETTWKTRTGWMIVRDALTVGPWHHVKERAHRQHRPPSDWEADHVFVRTARCAQGIVELQLECEPAFDYGATPAEWRYEGDGYTNAVASGGEGDPEIQLDTDMHVGFEGSRATARTSLREGEVAYVAISWSEHGGPKNFHEAFGLMDHTNAYWREWLSRGEFPDHPWRAQLERSALTLRGLTYAPTGAIVSAATTSLPRVSGGERNYDYRYSFMRDAAFALWGAYSLGFDWEADDFFYFLAELADHGDLPNIVGVDGRRDLDEQTLDHLSGYENSKPVRVGNAAIKNEQHDVWGAMLDAAYLHTKSRHTLPERIWPIVSDLVEQAVERWREPDPGIWASRGEPKHFTSSKVMSWVAAERGARIAEMRGENELAERWDAAADEIREDVCANALDDRGVFTQHYDTDALDASLLLMPLVRFLPGDDERVRRTVEAIADELVVDGLVLRQRPDQEEFAVEGETFTVCSFWLVSALVEIGEVERGRELCERLMALASSLGLYAEHLDPDSGRHLGNFPHAFTHLALVNAALHVIRAEGESLTDTQSDRVTTA
jgi:GH15 family glucan-1,4-alpha-glucosidase